jgi:hypothetical protein
VEGKKKIKSIQIIIREKRTVSDLGKRRSPTSIISDHHHVKKLTLRITMCVPTKNYMKKMTKSSNNAIIGIKNLFLRGDVVAIMLGKDQQLSEFVIFIV